MKHREAINKFWELIGAGKSAALDVSTETGEMVARFSKSAEGAEGNGTPPIPYTDAWARVMVGLNGQVRQG